MNKKSNITKVKPEVKKLSAEEANLAAKERVALINKEFSEGFEFIKKYPKSVTFFGSSTINETSAHYQEARKLAARLAKLGYAIVTGGGPGIMEAANRGAFEAGGKSVGLNITLPTEQKPNPYLTDYYQFYYFFSRKVLLSFAAEAYVLFPGGYGTFNEFYEIVTLIQTGRITPVPVILVGSDFWNPLDEYMRKVLLEKHATVNADSLEIYKITDDEEKIVGLILETPVIENIPFK